MTDEDQVRIVSKEFASAFVADNYPKLCSLYTSKIKASMVKGLRKRHKLPSGGCPAWLKEAFTAVSGQVSHGLSLVKKRLRNYKITSVRIKGDSAFVRDNTFAHPYREERSLRKENGRWLMNTIL